MKTVDRMVSGLSRENVAGKTHYFWVFQNEYFKTIEAA